MNMLSRTKQDRPDRHAYRAEYYIGKLKIFFSGNESFVLKD